MRAGTDIYKQIEEIYERNPILSVVEVLSPYNHVYVAEEAKDFIKNLYVKEESDKIIQQLDQFATNTGPFSDISTIIQSYKHLGPVTWWKENFANTAPELTKLATQIFSIP